MSRFLGRSLASGRVVLMIPIDVAVRRITSVTAPRVFSSVHPSVASEVAQYPTLGSLFHERCEQFSSRRCFISADKGDVLLYADVAKKTSLCTRTLYHRLHVRSGDTVMVLLPNHILFASLFHAILDIGATIAPVNPLFTVEELLRYLTQSKAKVVATLPDFLPLAHRLAAAASFERSSVTVYAGPWDCDDAIGLPEVPSSQLVGLTGRCDAVRESTAALLFSSGTTGLPKGIPLTHRNLVSYLFQTQQAVQFNGSDVMMAVLPYFHILGMVPVLHGMLNVGGCQVVVPRFDVEWYLELVVRHRATVMYVAPPIVVRVVKHILPTLGESRGTSGAHFGNFRHVRIVRSGAAPLGAEIHQRCEQCFPHASVIQGYGLTECPVVTHGDPAEKPTVYGSVGLLAADTELRIVDPESIEVGVEPPAMSDVPVGESGELLVRGPQVTRGYVAPSGSSGDAFLPGGWIRTGDLGCIDRQGHLYITERLKELVKFRGFQVAPAELEGVLLSHPLVQDAIVFGLPTTDGSGDEEPFAHIVLKITPEVGGEATDDLNATSPSETSTKKQIDDFVHHNVAPYKRLRGIRFVEEIPKTTSGKLLRRVARDSEVRSRRIAS